MALRPSSTRKFLVLCCALLGLGLIAQPSARAGDSLVGIVTNVETADTVTLDYGTGSYQLRIIGIDVPREGPLAQSAKKFTADLVLHKKVRMRFDHRTPQGVMLVRLLATDQPKIKDVGVELVRAGLAQRQKDYVEKYGELAKAEREAQQARRGLWSTQRPQ